MKKNNPHLNDDLINLSDFFNKLWKGKIIIFTISVLFSLTTYFYHANKPTVRQHQIEVVIKNPPKRIFIFFNYLEDFKNINNSSSNNFYDDYILTLEKNLLSFDNLQNFVDQNQKIDNFKNFLKLNNISTKQYFKDKFGKFKKEQIIYPNKFFLIYDDNLEKPDEFLTDYIVFVQKNNLKDLKNDLKYFAELAIRDLEKALQIAKSIDLTDPVLKSKSQSQILTYEPLSLFYRGTKVLTQQINYLEIFKEKIEFEQFNYDPFLEKPLKAPFVNQISVSPSINPVTYAFYSFTLVFFISIIIIFFKSKFR